jgi:AraC-like DNA-binding protein
MKITDVILVETGSDSDFVRLAAHVGGKLKKDTITINTDTGKGYIKQIELEKGLRLQSWNWQLSYPATLCYYPAPPGNSTICSLAYNLNRAAIIYRDHTSPDSIWPSRTNSVFINNSSFAVFDLVPRKQTRFIYLSMTREWVMRQFNRDDNDFIESLKQYIDKPIQPFLTTCSADEYIITNEIFENAGANTNMFFIQSRAYLLISIFFENLLNSKQEFTGHIGYIEKIRKAEMILKSHLQSNLPSLRLIADEVELSESILKRYFKLIYGYTIYEYYLQMKMELAKRLLIERNISVNEVAYFLKYENVSSFIAIFKNHFGYLPGLIRRNSPDSAAME